jgi:hypothetical protein
VELGEVPVELGEVPVELGEVPVALGEVPVELGAVPVGRRGGRPFQKSAGLERITRGACQGALGGRRGGLPRWAQGLSAHPGVLARAGAAGRALCGRGLIKRAHTQGALGGRLIGAGGQGGGGA